MKQKLHYTLFLFVCFTAFLNAQQQNDSLTKYSYEELHALIDSTKFDKPELSKIYTEKYLKRAKTDNDKIKISRGYFYLTLYYSELDREKAISYTDSIIEVCKTCNHKKYPALGYYFKGTLLYDKGFDELALENFLKSIDIIKKNKNILLEVDVRSAIVLLKSNWSTNKEVLIFLEETHKFIIKNKEKILDYENVYLTSLNNLIIEYTKNKLFVEALKVSEEMINESKSYKNLLKYHEAIFLTAIIQYNLKNHKASIDSLLKVLPYKKKYGLAISNYYLAKSYDKLKQPEKAQFHFLKTDSIYQATKDIFPEMRIAYEHIIDYYKSKNDAKNQIKYYDRLLAADAKIDSTYKYVTETVQKKYETPQIIAERARLMEEAKAKENTWKYSFGIISIILFVILGVLTYVFRRQKYYKKRFENIMSIERSRNVNLEKQKNEQKDIGVSEEIVEDILSQLSKFEVSEKFTKQTTLGTLAKDLKTNPKYLSKVINWHYQKNFSTYINELRIEYVISKLKEDSKFRNYTIKAMAEEAGFGNTESFSKAFYKNTGISPSYFIKELHKRLED